MISLSNNELPLVTVFTLIYNTNPEFVIEAIESIRAQTYPNIQHIIIDDCSTRFESKEVVKKWIAESQYNCVYVEHEKNYGICKTLNHVLDLAEGEYILGCSDDLLLPNAVEEQIKFAKAKSCRAVFCKIELFGNLKRSELRPNNDVVQGFNHLSSAEQFHKICESNFIPAVGAMVAKAVYEDIGKYDESLRFEDYDFWLRVLRKEKIMFNDMLLAKYRVHDSCFSAVFNDWDNDYLNIYLKHLDFSPIAIKKVETIALSAYRYKRTDILEKAFLYKAYSFRLRLLYAFCKLKVPVWLGYRILWRL
jgi:glycosyltransferase involved in cell wall biosynthesis